MNHAKKSGRLRSVNEELDRIAEAEAAIMLRLADMLADARFTAEGQAAELPGRTSTLIVAVELSLRQIAKGRKPTEPGDDA